ncbi:heavy metal translocating P-type ATPase [Bacillus sp. MUM 13]|uniref:heavy metal translocating P-type ATPase n=1 Tax=Bacillus sp. MUM 13 TaxID=1678001 RepID=UPI0008F57AA9|nr:heavy metal translocating P-type ATPase [Bacillus sp. MUM 13]OIK11837.1 cadmium transporter [Bacillus sp. MUM 13]
MEAEKQIYRVSGFTCAGCANTFEKNVRRIDGVEDAKVNFGALKITVYGQATIAEIEKAGSFEQIKVVPEGEKAENQRVPFYKRHAAVMLSVVFALIGYFFQGIYGENSMAAVAAYGAGILLGGYRLFNAGLKNLFKLDFDMKTLMTIAIIGAAVIGDWREGAVVVILFAVSEVLESYSMIKARQSIRALMEIAPKKAVVKRNDIEITIDVEDIEVGDVMIVKPGQKIPMDGIILKGTSSVNQAAITGESLPVSKTVSDEVFAGSLNSEGLLEVQITKRAEDTAIAKIIHLVEEAQGERAPSQSFIEKFAKYYTPVIMFISLLVMTLPPLIAGGSWGEWVYQGLSVLVVGCPCALVISTPVAIVTAIGNAAKKGVLIKGGVFLEEMGSLKSIAFDKTGTLTKGHPAVTDIMILDEKFDANEIFTKLAALEYRSQHPLSSAILKKAKELNLDFQGIEVEEFSAQAGKGIYGTINGEKYIAGKPDIFHKGLLRQLEDRILKMQKQGKTVMLMGTQTSILAIIAAKDEVRENVREVIQKLKELGIEKTLMLTGDNSSAASVIAAEAGISESKAELMPQEKLDYINKLQKNGKTAMVGDGVNDAPALAAAAVGISLGGAGTDTALETADVVLMADDLIKLPFAIKLSRKTLWVIKQNIAFSIGIKLLALLLVIPGWLTLWIAIFADMGATLIVTANSLRLLRVQEKKD